VYYVGFVDIGRIEITTKVSMLAAHMAMPREGHLYAVFRIFAYLKNKHNSRVVYDPTYPRLDHSQFKDNEDWKILYGDVKDAIPSNSPQTRGQSVVLRCYVDSDQVTARSRTGFIQMISMAPIAWFPKKQ
jgi:hypothetical protein